METKDLYQTIYENVPKGWEKVFEEAKDEIRMASDLVEERRKTNEIYPRNEDILKAFHLVPLDKVKVVIFGQEPYNDIYNGKPRDQGLAFSVDEEANVPPSVLNIFKELKSEYKEDFDMPYHGDISCWAKQGVLLLNRSLTTNAHQRNSHGRIWMGLIVRVIEALNQHRPRCIFVMWGRKVEALKGYINGKATMLFSSHPSSYSANKGFFGCNHFLLINDKLRELGEEEIDWSVY